MKNLKKSPILITILVVTIAFGYILHLNAAYNFGNWLMYGQNTTNPLPATDDDSETIQVALLLDTSNSMDGLIEQTKSQLWKIVGELNRAEQNGQTPNLEIALYEYGNDRLSIRDGYIRQVSAFTRDMDSISEKLFALRTNGGNEFCGQVINHSLDQLAWKNKPTDMRLVYIAGNEAFNQGIFSYQSACQKAKNRDIIVNTIFCGKEMEGINTFWKEGAELTGGNYMSMNQDKETVYIDSPYDDEIDQLNSKLNSSYIPYGKDGAKMKLKQIKEDDNAAFYSLSNKVDRALFKSSKNYSNEKWDLLDSYKKDKKIIKKKKQLPQEYKDKSEQEIEKDLKAKMKERKKIKDEIATLSEKRRDHIKKIELTQLDSTDLKFSIINSVKEHAISKGYTIKD